MGRIAGRPGSPSLASQSPSASLCAPGNRSEGLLRKLPGRCGPSSGAAPSGQHTRADPLSAFGRSRGRVRRRRGGVYRNGAPAPVSVRAAQGSYLVDPASSHMLVSKIKPCMSKYKLLIRRNCEWLIKSVRVYLMVPYYSDNRSKATANTCADPDLRRDVFIRFKADRACTLLVNHGNFTNRTASCRRCFIQLSALSTFDGSIEDYRGSNG